MTEELNFVEKRTKKRDRLGRAHPKMEKIGSYSD